MKPNCDSIASYGYRGLCRKHHDARQRELTRNGQLLGREFVDVAPTVAHIKNLQEAGETLRSIAQKAGISRETLWRLSKQTTVREDTAARIMRISCG